MDHIIGRRPLLWRPPRHATPQYAVLRRRPLLWRPPRHATPQYAVLRRRPLWRSRDYTGTGFIAGSGTGIVTVGGVPASRRVLLMARDRLRVIADVWSNDDGTYRFERLNEDQAYIVMALDHQGLYEPVAYDFVRPASIRDGSDAEPDSGAGDG